MKGSRNRPMKRSWDGGMVRGGEGVQGSDNEVR